MSSANVAEQMSLHQDSELEEAVDRLVKAEEASRIGLTINNVESAVANAPPGLAEETAIRVAQDYETCNNNVTAINDKIASGDVIIEVVGYIGTRKSKKNS